MQNDNVKFKVSKDIVVIYHGDCADGFSAAWAAWKKFASEADYYGAGHGESLPDGLINKEIYVLDFSFPKEIMAEVVKNNKKVVIIDHHKSAEESVKMAHEYVYEMDRSGAVLAWQYFFPELAVPWLLRYISDRDIWKLELPDTFAIGLMLDTFDKNFETWSKLAEELEDGNLRNQYIEKGKLIQKYEHKIIEDIISSNKEVVIFEGHEIYAVNAPHFFASQMGNFLCREKPPFAIVWQWSGEIVKVSLRSDGTVDVSEIAKKFGGGGHKAAAAFRVESLEKLPWKSAK
jgi:oligoribonuclease NrnB/cAMP/cGMP phosphodiesterase (DHH superfamily)